MKGFCYQRKREIMDWVKEIKERVGVTDERYVADLNDMDGREILTEEHLDRIKENVSNMNVTDRDSSV